jgi:hypothetical protein
MQAKRALKRLLIVFLVLCCLLAVAGVFAYWQLVVPADNQFVFKSSEGTVPMRWVRAAAAPENPYGALLVPVRIANIDQTFYLQLDLGHPTTVFYRTTMDSIASHYGSQVLGADGSLDKLRNLDLVIGTVSASLKKANVINTGPGPVDWDSPPPLILIGTLGSDFIDQRSVVLDYVRMEFLWSDHGPPVDVPPEQLHSFEWTHRRILLPCTIDGRSTKLLFDTGSSAFELVTDRQTWNQLAAPGTETVEGKVNSWGKQLTAYTCQTTAVATFPDASLPVQNVTYMEGMGFWSETAVRLTGMTGITGNKLFLGRRLLLDVKNQRFAILN